MSVDALAVDERGCEAPGYSVGNARADRCATLPTPATDHFVVVAGNSAAGARLGG